MTRARPRPFSRKFRIGPKSLAVPGLIVGALLWLPASTALATPANPALPADLDIDTTALRGGKAALLCLALNDYWEARGEPLRGRLAVAQVVLNRVADARYPDTVCEVVYHDLAPDLPRACQFSWTCDGRPATPTDAVAWTHAVKLAAAVLEADAALEDPTNGALWYHATHVQPAWRTQFAKAEVIGRHVFYRDRPPLPTPRPGIPPVQVADVAAGDT